MQEDAKKCNTHKSRMLKKRGNIQGLVSSRKKKGTYAGF